MNVDNKPVFLLEAEKILKDRCSDYMIVCIYDECVHSSYNNNISAYGMCELTKQEIEGEWANDREE